MTAAVAYRAVPADVTAIRPGDWIALDEGYAVMHAEGMADYTGEPWHVITTAISECDAVWAADRDEWFADTGERREFFYLRLPPEVSA